MKAVTVIGLGNIGSHLIRHLARMQDVGIVTLIDHDKYEEKNRYSQDILPRDIGKPKAVVQARQLKWIRPDVRVIALVGSVEDLPLGFLRAHVLLGCLDSRRARQYVNRFSWRLGIPWIDAGVRPEESLVRVSMYSPGENQPCLECGWSDSDYSQIEQEYPCDKEPIKQVRSTDAPSELGALAAALQAAECRKILATQADCVGAGCQLTFDVRWHKHYVSSLRRNPACLFDHKTWSIAPLGCRLESFSAEDALRFGDRIELEGKPFVKMLRCRDCGTARILLRLLCSMRSSDRKCRQCGGKMAATGFDLLERIDRTLPCSVLSRSLRGLGLRFGDVFHTGDDNHFEIVCEER